MALASAPVLTMRRDDALMKTSLHPNTPLAIDSSPRRYWCRPAWLPGAASKPWVVRIKLMWDPGCEAGV